MSFLLCSRDVTERPIHLLLVEDEAGFAYLLRAVLTNLPSSRFETEHAKTFAEAVEFLSTKRFDLILLDLTLPDRCGLDTYTGIQKVAPTMPVIVLTGSVDESMALHAVREGAQDYLVKGQVDGKMLSRVIRYAIERKGAEETVRQSEEFFRLISENVSDLIAVIDQDGRRLYNSPSYRKLLGDPANLRGTDSFEELHPEDRERVREIFRQTVATGSGQRAEYRLVTKEGEIRHIESQGNAIRDEKGQTCKVVVVARDITDRKESLQVLRDALSDVKRSHDDLKATQLQLIRAERLEAISTFAAGVAHEVKNPLQTITLGLDYLSGQTAARTSGTSRGGQG